MTFYYSCRGVHDARCFPVSLEYKADIKIMRKNFPKLKMFITVERKEKEMVNCWAMRTSRNSEEHRRFVYDELQSGRLRQGWGWHESQDLHRLEDLWTKRHRLSDIQDEAARHWRMGNGQGENYMQIGDLVVVANVPDDGLFTICRIRGDYEYEIAKEFGDFGHVRPVEVLTLEGVSNDHRLVHADLRRSFRCRSRLWNIKSHYASLDLILRSGLASEELTRRSTPEGRVESIVSELITEPLNLMADRLGKKLPERLQAEEWEPVLRSALEFLFPVSVHGTGGPHERGADIEIVIPNPFEENQRWIVPVQVKDYEGEVGAEVADQLKEAYESRSQSGRVIAVVLLVSNAEASKALTQHMDELRDQYGVPFVFCGRDRFLQLLAQGYLRRPMD